MKLGPIFLALWHQPHAVVGFQDEFLQSQRAAGGRGYIGGDKVMIGEDGPCYLFDDDGTLLNWIERAPKFVLISFAKCIDYSTRLLRAGIQLQGFHYNFYGHSNSQLKSRTCFFFAAPNSAIQAKVDALGDFGSMKTVQKKAKRIGLLFSVADVVMTINPSRCEDISDIEKADYVFTDLVAPKFAQHVARRISVKFRIRYTPSVYQVRYRGYKGVATTDPRMKEDDAQSAFRFLTYINGFDLAERLIVASLEAVWPIGLSLIKTEHSKITNNRDEQRRRILILESRILFVVCDALDVLEEGVCHVRITHDFDGQAQTLNNANVVVTRNPCLHPGNIQKFKVVQKDDLSHLVDCIVFSTRGNRPAADLMSGGDLDGDQFFAAEYPGARDPVSFKPITDDDRLVYFAKYTSASLGRAKNLHLDWARVAGPMSSQCQEMNRLFSTCVDGNRINIPQRLESPPRPSADKPPFILDEIHSAAKRIIHEWHSTPHTLNCDGYSLAAIEFLLSRHDLAVSEFELIQLGRRWC
ncbi:RNA dependent RNA polymerase-domain-containing protein [Lasiosphaeria ovina]|uniref:RNA-dependent RNA polymerase n=1 Tax=Lasiosphaeria ovina TaxID=92902 RepID=A0AAE0JSA5_9PEZI|nr:RNA dependent RNA polymerase-domain-containing protein [Lasiosphaeria ovina]